MARLAQHARMRDLCGRASARVLSSAWAVAYVMVHITGRINMADILTKAQAVSVFSELMGAYRLHTSAPSDKVADDGQEGVSRPNPSE